MKATSDRIIRLGVLAENGMSDDHMNRAFRRFPQSSVRAVRLFHRQEDVRIEREGLSKGSKQATTERKDSQIHRVGGLSQVLTKSRQRSLGCRACSADAAVQLQDLYLDPCGGENNSSESPLVPEPMIVAVVMWENLFLLASESVKFSNPSTPLTPRNPKGDMVRAQFCLELVS